MSMEHSQKVYLEAKKRLACNVPHSIWHALCGLCKSIDKVIRPPLEQLKVYNIISDNVS